MALKFALSKIKKEGILLKQFQEDVINAYSQGKDCFCIATTGSGKSMTFVLAPFIFDYMKCMEDSFVIIVQPLVALMKDQVAKLNELQIPALYVGDETVKRDDIVKKKIKFIIGAPESVLKKQFMQLLKDLKERLCVIFIDESHCIRTMGYSKDKQPSNAFRKVYSELGRLRSVLTDIPVVTLTATATIDIRETIISDFCMTNCEFVVTNCDKKNVRYSVIDVVNDMEVNFGWLIQELKDKGAQTKRVIVFCQSRKQCTELYSLFKDKLGPNSYQIMDQKSEANGNNSCIFAMYHLTTLDEQKFTVEKSFRDYEGIIRVLFCTSSFGMGIDVKGCNLCIHYGPPSSIDEYIQQTGRIGRDGSPCHALLLKYKKCFTASRVENNMKEFCETKMCRRQVLMKAINNDTQSIEIGHSCCDICSIKCQCLCQCNLIPCICSMTCQSSLFVSSSEESTITDSNNEFRSVHKNRKIPIYNVSEQNRDLFESSLLDYRKSLLNETEKEQLLVHSDLVTGFSIALVSDLAENMEYLADISYIIQNFPIFNHKHAQAVIDILLSIAPEVLESHQSMSDLYDALSTSEEDLSSSDDDSYSQEIFSRPCIIYSDSESN